jgi:hypothetical protein
MARVAGHTLNTGRKGRRGRLRWLNPSRSAHGLKTAQIGKGQGGSTQPIRVLGSRVVHSEVLANVRRGGFVFGDGDEVAGEPRSFEGDHL